MADTEKLAEAALNGSDNPQEEVNVFVPRIKIRSYKSLVSFEREDFNVNVSVPDDAYPDSVTDQTHRASISEQIRQGQGDMDSMDDIRSAFDFPDGKDDGSAGVGVFDLSEPSDAYEAEQSFKKQLARDASLQRAAKVAKADADKAQNKAIEQAKEASVTKMSTEPKTDAQNQS